MSIRRKYGDELLVESVRNELHGCLFHQTDEAHLASIEQHGLLSERSRIGLGIDPPFPGGNSLSNVLDRERQLDSYVFLSFFNLGVMPKHNDFRRRRPIILKIDASAIFIGGVKVALGRANGSRTEIYRAARAFYNMDWPVISGEVSEKDVEYPRRSTKVCDYEILVPEVVPLQYIIGVV